MNAEVILPCPFCGGAGHVEKGYYCDDEGEWPAVLCDGERCHASGPVGNDTAEAIAMWNERK